MIGNPSKDQNIFFLKSYIEEYTLKPLNPPTRQLCQFIPTRSNHVSWLACGIYVLQYRILRQIYFQPLNLLSYTAKILWKFFQFVWNLLDILWNKRFLRLWLSSLLALLVTWKRVQHICIFNKGRKFKSCITSKFPIYWQGILVLLEVPESSSSGISFQVPLGRPSSNAVSRTV